MRQKISIVLTFLLVSSAVAGVGVAQSDSGDLDRTDVEIDRIGYVDYDAYDSPNLAIKLNRSVSDVSIQSAPIVAKIYNDNDNLVSEAKPGGVYPSILNAQSSPGVPTTAINAAGLQVELIVLTPDGNGGYDTVTVDTATVPPYSQMTEIDAGQNDPTPTLTDTTTRSGNQDGNDTPESTDADATTTSDWSGGGVIADPRDDVAGMDGVMWIAIVFAVLCLFLLILRA
jgi:hypothetical protein